MTPIDGTSGFKTNQTIATLSDEGNPHTNTLFVIPGPIMLLHLTVSKGVIQLTAVN
jgi:hypothetical protein